MPPGPRKKHPGPRKNRELLVECEESLVDGTSDQSLPILAEKYNVAESTVSRYYKFIHDRWATEEREQRPQRREHFRAMAMDAYRLAKTTKNALAAAAVLRLLAKLDGLEAPVRVALSVTVDIRAMAPEERHAEIERLWELRKMALAQRGAPLQLCAPEDKKTRPAVRSGGQ